MDLPDPLITISPDYLSGAPIFPELREVKARCTPWRRR